MSDPKTEEEPDFMTEWTTNENLLQSYRLIAVSSQSFFLAVGTLLTQDHLYVFLFSALVALIMIWFIWFPIVRSRHRIVDFYKNIQRLERWKFAKVPSESDSAERSVRDKRIRNRIKALFGTAQDRFTYWRDTRIKLDFCLPVLFTLLWLALLIEQFIRKRDLLKILFTLNKFSIYGGGFVAVGLIGFFVGCAIKKRNSAPAKKWTLAWGMIFLLFGLMLHLLGHIN